MADQDQSAPQEKESQENKSQENKPETRKTQTPGELAPEDFYFEGPCLVFTDIYHRKRGYCCNSDCRHCPYR